MEIISFIIPCYRSEFTIEQVVSEIISQFSGKQDFDYQIILVCDGSPDNTFGVIRALCKNDGKIIGLNLSRNFGGGSARMAALPYVKGAYVVYMDDDGQHPAEGIFPLIEKLKEGYDMVYAHFKHKKHTLLKRFGSYVNRVMTEILIGKPRHIFISSFNAKTAFVSRELQRYSSPSPYGLGYLMQITRNIANVEMEHRTRIAGKSGYTFIKSLRLWMNGFASFSVVPLRIFSIFGSFCSLFGFIFGIVLIIQKILNPHIAAGYTSTMASLFFIGGVLMMMLGLLGEYVGRMFMVLNNLPQYVVREVINNEN
ncbi:glycosyltransferase [Treponema primitia]|uniref:glycosyltransferase n=1 Tax=Treponema primitia TaxID=88058 RepID=UPI0002554EE2|nr:glycosyltransferase [Treponema primitia]